AAGVEALAPLDAEARLERALGVVEARVHDLAVPAGGLARDRLAALEHDDAAPAARERRRRREADDPRPDDEDVDLRLHAARAGGMAGDRRSRSRNAARRCAEVANRNAKTAK